MQARDVLVITSRYEFEHGKLPRGFGCWAFRVNPRNDVGPAWFNQMSWGDAKRAAQKLAAEQHVSAVEVLP